MLPEYDFRDAKRGVHHLRCAEGTNVRLLSQELADKFPDDASLNAALEELLRLRRESAGGRQGV